MMAHNNGSGWLVRINRKSGDMWEFRKTVEQADGSIKLRKQIACSVAKYPTKELADKSPEVAELRLGQNGGINIRMSDLIAAYRNHEDGMLHLAFSTRDRLEPVLQRIEGRWGKERVFDIRTPQISEWLKSLKKYTCNCCKKPRIANCKQPHDSLSPESRAKIRNVMCELFVFGTRKELFGLAGYPVKKAIRYNPVRGEVEGEGVYFGAVRRLRKPDTLNKEELKQILARLPLRERTAVRLANLGLRRSEIRGLKWHDFNFAENEFTVSRSVVDGVIGSPKTEASAESVKMDEYTKADVLDWKKTTLYKAADDFVFSASPGVALELTAMLRRQILPAVAEVAADKKVGWHTFRRSFATRLVNHVPKGNVKTAQALMRHANSKITLDLYAQGDDDLKQAAVDALAIPLASQMVQ